MSNVINKGILDFLVRQTGIDDSQLDKAVQQAKINHVPIIRYLADKELINPRQFARQAADFFSMNLFDLDVYDQEIIPYEYVNERLISNYHCFPLYKQGRNLLLAVSDPLNLSAIREYRYYFGTEVDVVMVEDDKLKQLVDHVIKELSKTSMPEFSDDDLSLDVIAEDQEEDLNESDINEDDGPIIRFVNKTIVNAINLGASDIHFEPFERQYRVRYRVDGILQEAAAPPVSAAPRITSRLKILSQLDIAEKRVPQDGRFKLRISANNSVEFRVSTCPTSFGEKVVLRILDKSAAQVGIEKLGFEPDQERNYMKTLGQSQGMILVTGPTGSGKTVTLYTGLNIINSVEKNISTAEDPVEINVEGINQVQVNVKQGLTFAAALKAFLRQDPDIIMVGEIRNHETAEIAIQASQTGHLVLSTLHTNSAPETLSRLMDIGVPHYNIANSVSLIIAQRLGRRLCDHCKEVNDLPEETLREIGFTQDQIDQQFTVYKANSKGCARCNFGFKGRVGLFEVMPVSRAMQRLILEGHGTTSLEEQARKEGIVSIYQCGLIKVAKGVTSLEEVNRVSVQH